jgi:predicted ATPase/class 3 adenylate cyclase/Tfp pilus assembly protein PilF
VGLYRGELLEGCSEEWALQERQTREAGYLSALERLAEVACAEGKPALAVDHLRRVVTADPMRESAQRALMSALAADGNYAEAVQVYREVRLRLREQLNADPDAATTALFERLRREARERTIAGRRERVAVTPSVSPSGTGASSGSQGLETSHLSSLASGLLTTVTLLFTDIEGSTSLWEKHPQAMRMALRRHDELLREAIETQGGEVFKTIGDAFCAVFPSASDALVAAMEAQKRLASETWPADTVLKVRMALHTGTVERRDNDYFGAAVNRVARLLSIGHGGQILLSSTAREMLGETLPEGVSLRELGSHRVKGVEQPIVVFETRHPAFAQEFPALRSLSACPNNLPQQLTSFIGRGKERAEIKELLGKARLLTLTGLGGSGKTRLALEVASEVLSDYPDGVWLVELAALSEASLLPHRVLGALGVREEPGKIGTETLIGYLGSKRLLLVLDNCEHLVERCATLTDTLLRSCPNLTILATSREALKVNGEQPWRVPAMGHPLVRAGHVGEEAEESLLQYDACRLFVERARVHRADLSIGGATGRAVASICSRLDGIPLALELAAARVRSLSVEEINTRLDQRFRLLKGGSRTALPRHQTLRALIDWSYELLNGQERTLLCRLCVFAGGWTLEAAEQVVSAEATGGGESIEDWEVLDLLTSLVDKSLVVVEAQEERTRYHLLETVREYAWDRLVESGESTAVRERHLGYFLALAEEAEPKLTGVEQVEWFQILEAEHENLQDALDWCQDPETGLRLASSLCGFWEFRGQLAEGRSYLERALDRDGAQAPTLIRAMALNAVGHLAFGQGDYAQAVDLTSEALTIQQELGDRRGKALSLYNLAHVAQEMGNLDQAQAWYEESLILEQEIGNQGRVAFLLLSQGRLAGHRRDFALARTRYEESRAKFQEVGDQRGIAITLYSLGTIARRQADYTTARTLCEKSLVTCREIGDRRGICFALNSVGGIAMFQGDYACAQACYDESLAIRRESGVRSEIANSLNTLGWLALIQGDYATARTYLEESLIMYRATEGRSDIAYTLINLGSVAYHQGDLAAARALYEESLSLLRTVGNRGYPSVIAELLIGFASLAAAQNTMERAATLWGAAEAQWEEIESDLPPVVHEQYERGIAPARQALGEEAFATAQAKGRAMTVEQAIEYAREPP